MLNTDEASLECDLMETYGIYDYRALPPTKVALFSCGLRDNSRIKMKITERKATTTELLLASITDRLSYLVWFQTKDGQKNRNRPKSVYEQLIGKSENPNDAMVFDSGAEFEEARRKILEERKKL